MGTADGSAEVVLIVDSFDGRDMYAEYFASRGLTVCTAVSADQAVELLDIVKPSVIVSDLVFLHNHIDASTFISFIRSRPEFDLTSIIVVSGYVREEDRDRARHCGADLFLIKPCLPHTLLGHVERALVSHRQGSRLKGHWTSQALDRRHVLRAADRDRRRYQPGTRPPF